MRKLSVLITVLMFTMLTVGAQSTIGKHRFISGGAPGCTAGPTANMLLRLDSTTTTPGNITTWVSGVGGITATAVGSGTVTSYANVFGTQPGVRLTAANSQYFLLSSVVNGGASINNLTVMSVVKFNSPTTEQVLTSGASGQGAFTYWVGNSVSWLQGADVDRAQAFPGPQAAVRQRLQAVRPDPRPGRLAHPGPGHHPRRFGRRALEKPPGVPPGRGDEARRPGTVLTPRAQDLG